MNRCVLSRTEVDSSKKRELNIRNDVTTKAIDVNKQSTGVAEEEPLRILNAETPQKKSVG